MPAVSVPTIAALPSGDIETLLPNLSLAVLSLAVSLVFCDHVPVELLSNMYAAPRLPFSRYAPTISLPLEEIAALLPNLSSRARSLAVSLVFCDHVPELLSNT